MVSGPLRCNRYRRPVLYHARLAHHDVVDGDRLRAFQHDAGLVMVLHRLANARQVVPDFNSQFGQMRARPDAGQQQQLRRIQRATAQDHLPPCARGECLPVFPPGHADGALGLQHDALGQRMRDHPQVAPLHRRPQIADRGRATASIARGQMVIPGTLLHPPIEIVVARETKVNRALDERLADRIVFIDLRHRERTAGAMQIVATADLILGAFEVRQHVVERPAGIAELAPVIEILSLAADIDQTVDRR